MADKHSPLSEVEIAEVTLPAALQQALAHIPTGGRVLDWGCGRGRTVLRLRDTGVAAWGLDVDSRVLAQAEPALARRGLSEAGVLRRLPEVETFPDGYFDLIFSEETLEHIESLDELAATAYRLTAAGGVGLHSFPGWMQWREPHVQVPLVHWLPGGFAQRALLFACLCMGAGPRPPWPETHDGKGALLPRSRQAAVYARYLREKVHYRSIEDIADIFRRAGFQVSFRCQAHMPVWCRLLPRFWRQNGFPAGNLLLVLHKEGSAGSPPVPSLKGIVPP